MGCFPLPKIGEEELLSEAEPGRDDLPDKSSGVSLEELLDSLPPRGRLGSGDSEEFLRFGEPVAVVSIG
jgi:hypothetical protein